MKIRKGIIITHVYREDTRQALLGISFPTNGGGRKFSTFDPSLRESALKLCRALVKAGAKMEGTTKVQEKKLAKLLANMPDKQMILVDQPGFRVTKAGPGYVLGPHNLGAAKGRFKWRPTDHNRGVGQRKGTLVGWREHVAPLASKSTYAMFSVFTALAAPLNSYVNLEVGKTEGVGPLLTEMAVMNSSGEGSTGKSSQLRLAAGVWGNPDLIFEWDFTRRGLEEAAAAHNDGPFVIDDTDKITETEMPKKVAFKLVNQIVPKGQSKAISGRARGDYPLLRWSTFGISSSLRPFDEEAAEAGFKRSPGEKYRLIDIPLPKEAAGGIFDRVEGSDEHRKNEAAALIPELELGIATHYGVLMRPWIEFLLAQPRATRIHELVAEFVTRVAPNAGGQEGRLAKKFGVIYAAGVLAIEADLLPWGEDEPMKVVRKLYLLARKSIVSDDDLATARLKTFADAVKDPNKFPEHDGEEVEYTKATIGIRTRSNGHDVCCIRDEEFGKLVGSKGVKRALLERLKAAGALSKGQGHAGTVQHRLPISVSGKAHDRPRFWTILLDKLADAAAS